MSYAENIIKNLPAEVAFFILGEYYLTLREITFLNP